MGSALPIDGRAKRLKAATEHAHDALDQRIMAGEPFADRARYARFLRVQHGFHRDIAALYAMPAVAALIPDLDERPRLAEIERDLADLGVSAPVYDAAPLLAADADLPTALGWMYVAEGSNLGAAFLLKEARKLELDERYGARHLSGHPEGRGLHWRRFTTALDGLDVAPEAEARMNAGAVAAFRRVHALVEAEFRD